LCAFLQDRGAYKHENACFVSLHIFFSEKITIKRQPSIDFDFYNLSSSGDKESGDIDIIWLLIYFTIL